MPRNDESPSNGSNIPLREELESRFNAKIVTYENDGNELPGGMCGCCVPEVPYSDSGRIGGRDALLVMFVFLNRGRLVGHLYLGSTLMEDA